MAAAEDALARGRAGCAVCGLTCTPWPRDARARARASGCVRASGCILTDYSNSDLVWNLWFLQSGGSETL